MELTTEIVKKYEGGQLEIQNRVENYLYRGEIETAEVKDDTLNVLFKWLAKMENGTWHAHGNLDYSISLEITNFNDVGNNLILYEVMYIWENGTFFPPNGSKLDPREVIGLHGNLGESMSHTRPDFAKQIKKDMELTPEEAQEFLKLEVLHLANSVVQTLIDAPGKDPYFENREHIKEREKLGTEYETLLYTASPRVVEAMKRFFEMELAYLESVK